MFLRLIVTLLCFLSVFCGLSANAQAKATVTVVPPTIETGADASDYPVATLTQEIEAALVATRVFSVLTSNSAEIDILLREINAGGSRVTPQSKTAQFVVIPVIQAVELERSARPIPRLSDKVRVQSNGLIRMRVKVIETRTGIIKAPFPVDVDWKGEAEVTDSYVGIGLGFRPSDFVEMSREAGRILADRLLDQVYPVEVLARDGDSVWISRGSDAGYKVGEIFRIMSGAGTAEQLIHPVTGEVLGVREKPLGKIEIVDVQPKFTVGKITEESGGVIGKGAIVRR